MMRYVESKKENKGIWKGWIQFLHFYRFPRHGYAEHGTNLSSVVNYDTPYTLRSPTRGRM